ncbi:hypothetical protein [Sphingomonas sp. LM7]|uniref:hypothetical protein n=1 Tax=Sphingomonas sp. LM7 TaxID=1938607 RepID=UPI000983CA89|nr:hypothetical protein [Sphingomonas sp. LM7]AQR73728.1 hypothetical protein BXU08_08795 [Sphingomonas sp. LM7]
MNLPLAPAIAGALGGAVALCALAVPMPVLEALVMDSGLPAIIAAAEPPLGFTARAAVAILAGGTTALFGWFALSLLLGTRSISLGADQVLDLGAIATPILRRADAHPDAPPRAPLLATRDLGRPFLDPRGAFEAEAEVEPELVEEIEAEAPVAPPAITPQPIAPVEQPLPRDLDQPLSAFDPAAVPDVPMPAPVALPPLQRSAKPPVFDESERFEIFELRPPVRPAVAPAPRPVSREDAITRPETEASVHALLERLERGVVRKGIAAAPATSPTPSRWVERRAKERGLEDALVTLRNMARRA